MSISLKVNIIVGLEFKLADYDATVEHISHYIAEAPHKKGWFIILKDDNVYF